jgi:FMN-dependent NADH-azoreductase
MKRILFLTSSIQGSSSYSTQLGRAIVESVMEKYPGSKVEEVNLVEHNIPHLSSEQLTSFYTPGDQLTDEQKEAIRYSDAAIEQLMKSDIVVIGAPLYNFTIHTALKSWIDQITRAGVTFGYGEDGRPAGKVIGKKVYVAMSSGGIYSEGPGKENDFVAPYLKNFLGALGMTDLTVFRAEGLKVPGVKDQAFERAVESIEID